MSAREVIARALARERSGLTGEGWEFYLDHADIALAALAANPGEERLSADGNPLDHGYTTRG